MPTMTSRRGAGTSSFLHALRDRVVVSVSWPAPANDICVGPWTAAMAFGASAGYLDLLQALNSHPNTQGGMRNAGMPLAMATIAATVGFWALSVVAEGLAARLRIRAPRAAVLALIAAVVIAGEGIHPAADRLAVLRLLLSSATLAIIALVVYQGLSSLGKTTASAATVLGPWLLGAVALLSMGAYRRTIGPLEFAALLPVLLAAVAAIAWRRRASRWFIAVPWTVALLTPLFDRTPATPTLRHWIAGPIRERDAGRPDVLLITVDALRADALNVHGGTTAKTPALNRLASESYVFEQARSPAPWTLPAMASLFTGVDVSVHGISGLLTGLPPQLVTLPEALHRGGYYTAAFGAGNGLLAEEERQFWRGFDSFEFVSTPFPSTMWAATFLPRLLPQTYSGKLSATEFAPRVAAHMSKRRGNAFTWVHLFDTHSPYRSHGPGPRREFGAIEDIQAGVFVPSPAERADIRRLYDDEVEEMDRGVDILLDSLRRSGQYDTTLILFVADHGEEFWDHGSIGHGRSLYRDQIHVPLIIKLPGRAGAVRVPTPVSTANVAATIVDVVGLPASVAGQPLSAAWDGRTVLQEAPVVSGMASAMEDPRRAVTFGSWVYMAAAANGREELFDFRADPREQTSQVTTRPFELERGRALLAAANAESLQIRTALGLRVPTTREVDPILRSMGYIQ